MDAKSRCQAYRERFHQQLDPGVVDAIRQATHGGFVLGSERFQQDIAAGVGRRTWRGLPGRPVKAEE